jgi:hypothetical protein
LEKILSNVTINSNKTGDKVVLNISNNQIDFQSLSLAPNADPIIEDNSKYIGGAGHSHVQSMPAQMFKEDVKQLDEKKKSDEKKKAEEMKGSEKKQSDAAKKEEKAKLIKESSRILKRDNSAVVTSSIDKNEIDFQNREKCKRTFNCMLKKNVILENIGIAV